MNRFRSVALLLLGILVSPQLLGAQGGGHDVVLGAFAPGVPALVAGMSPVCIVLPVEENSVVVGVVDGTVSPVALEEILAEGGARERASRLSREMVGLLSAPRRGQAAAAVREFNAFVLESSSEFLQNPPVEFLAVHRIIDHVSGGVPVVDDWVCPTAPEPVVVERLIQICILLDNDLQIVTATFRPETGDTLLDGLAFRDVHSPQLQAYGANQAWFTEADSMMIDGQEWVKFGVTRAVRPEDVIRVGSHQGTPLFTEARAEAPFTVLYVPVRPGCEVQPYQPRAVLRIRGG